MSESENIFRNRYISNALFKPVDRAWRHEFMGFWDKTLTRWHGEGLSYENWLFYRDLVRDVVDKHYGIKDG